MKYRVYYTLKSNGRQTFTTCNTQAEINTEIETLSLNEDVCNIHVVQMH